GGICLRLYAIRSGSNYSPWAISRSFLVAPSRHQINGGWSRQVKQKSGSVLRQCPPFLPLSLFQPGILKDRASVERLGPAALQADGETKSALCDPSRMGPWSTNGPKALGTYQLATAFLTNGEQSMPDDLTSGGPQDRSRISLLEPHEVQYWADKFNVSKERL